MSKEQFTNRHGVTTTLSGDLPASPDISSRSLATGRRLSLKLPAHKPIGTYRRVLLGGLIVLALLLTAAVVVVANDLNRFQTASRSMNESVQKASRHISPASSDLRAQVAVLMNDLPAVSCPGAMPLTRLYGEVKQALGDCEAKQQLYSGIRKDMAELRTIADYNSSLSSIFKSAVSNPSDGAFVVISQAADNWRSATDKLTKLSPPSRLAPAYNGLKQATTALADSWQALNRANGSHDVAGYEKSRLQLAADYDNFRKASQLLITDIAPVQQHLLTSIKAFQ